MTKQMDTEKKAARIFQDQGGVLTTTQALRSGIHARTLYRMRDSGLLERLDRGLFRLAALSPPADPDLISAAIRVPRGVLCLISALSFHGITTQIPHEIYLALPRGTEPPRLSSPPLRIFWFGGESYQAGIEQHRIDRIDLRVYSPEKTVADCFKMRNRIGADVAVEALRLYAASRSMDIDKLLHFARICRVEGVMRPYLEALL
jgi:predicted transcriptional regulator of viral defense system